MVPRCGVCLHWCVNTNHVRRAHAPFFSFDGRRSLQLRDRRILGQLLNFPMSQAYFIFNLKVSRVVALLLDLHILNQ